ncbi:MAG TPA: YceI family protein [Sphingobacteriaceae bacterium]
MKSIAILFILTFGLWQQTSAPARLYVSRSIKTTIFSEAPLENIEATSNTGVAILNTETGEVQFNIPIRSFNFRKRLMQEHFNENYMESDKYPHAKFKGKIRESIDYSVDGTYEVTTTGELEVHGVKKPRTIAGTITVNGGSISIQSKFDTRVADHNIKIPQLVFRNIAETIRVTVSGTFTPHTKTES